MGKGKRNREVRERARREAEQRAERPFPDPRLWTTEVSELGGKPVTEPTFIFPVDRLRLDDGRVLAFHAPTMPGFFLVTAKELRDEGERQRQEVLASLRPATEREDWADVNVSDDSLALDALGKLASAVILSAAAIEAYANEAVDRLPKLTGVATIKGREPWPRFVRLNELRGEVVHYKPRGKTDDPDLASALGRLLKGEASTCVEDAAAVVLAYEPNVLPEATKQALALDR